MLSRELTLSSLFQDGYTPLMRAAQFGNEESVEVLLDNGADALAVNKVNRSHPSLRHHSFQYDSRPCERLQDGVSALQLAADEEHTRIMNMLNQASSS